ncbi:MAG: response regulator transcription factor [Clostridiales bacterium]|jgi:DNA-binding response OmpR family regulator|nr:response regulator transcription factor [Clostridiales bacterium]
MDNYEILVVEDDPDINGLLCRLLKKQGYSLTAAYSGSEARLLLSSREFDLVLLDLMLPGVTGDELIAEIRAARVTPVIVISARTAQEDKVRLLRSGADDYIVKPFDVDEVVARVEAQLRRYRAFPQPTAASGLLTLKNLTLDREAIRAEVHGKELTLTAREFNILSLLMEHPDKVFTRENLYHQVWNEEYYGEDNTVNVHISNIRQKLQRLDPGVEYIKTVWGIGFKMSV